MTTDDLRTRAREAARERGLPRHWSVFVDGYTDGFLAHASQQPSREQIARAIYDALGGDYAPYRAATDAVLALFDGAGS